MKINKIKIILKLILDLFKMKIEILVIIKFFFLENIIYILIILTK